MLVYALSWIKLKSYGGSKLPIFETGLFGSNIIASHDISDKIKNII